MPLNKAFHGMLSNPTNHVLIMLITFLGALMRIPFLDDIPLWYDEAYSVWFANQEWSYLWKEVPEFETHPPFYYSVLKLGQSALLSTEFGLRILSAIASVGVIPLIYVSALILYGPQRKAVALIAAFFAATWWPQIEFALQARPYGFIFFTMAMLLPALFYLLKNFERLDFSQLRDFKSNICIYISLFFIAASIALFQWFHNLGILYNLSIAAALLIGWLTTGQKRVGAFLVLLATGLISILLYAPNIPNILSQAGMVSDNFWLESPGLKELAENVIEIYALSIWKGFEVLSISWLTQLALISSVIGCVFVIYFAFVSAHKALSSLYSKANTQLLMRATACLIFLPVLASLAITYAFKPVFLERTLIAVQIPLFLILAALPFLFQHKLIRSLAVFIALTLPLLWSAASLYYTIKGPLFGERSMPEIVKVIDKEGPDSATIVVYPNALEHLFDYYRSADTQNPLYALPKAYPAHGLSDYTYPAGGAVPQAKRADVKRLLAKAQSNDVWYIVRFPQLFDPDEEVLSSFKDQYRCHKKYSVAKKREIIKLYRFSNNARYCAKNS